MFEIIAFIFALPFSYAITWLIKKNAKPGYKDELDRLFLIYWDGKPSNELHAWQRVQHLVNQKKSRKHQRYIQERMREVNKNTIVSEVLVNEYGEFKSVEQRKTPSKPKD
ncbi:MAG: hypothetical protein AAFW89_07600 [Bacteroidota bacterium]